MGHNYQARDLEPITATKRGLYLLQLEKTGRNNNLRYAADTTLMEESKEELKSLLMRVKEESKEAGLKLKLKKKKKKKP